MNTSYHQFSHDKYHAESHVKYGELLKEAVFGFNDGVVSTFAVVAGLTGGAVDNKTVLLAALATLLAGILSMGLGTYMGSKAEKELYEKEHKRELYEIENMPDIERREVRDIYEKKGFSGKLLEEIVEKITADKKVWLNTMMTEELGFAQKPPAPWKNGLAMSTAFMFGSLFPTVPYFFKIKLDGIPVSFVASLCLSIVGLLFVGGFKTRFTGKKILVSAFETLLVGTVAAVGSYGIGALSNAVVLG